MSRTKNKELPEGWDELRLQQLLEFARSTPDQKLQWLTETLQLFASVLPKKGRESD